MKTRTHLDSTFLTTGFGDLVTLKKIVINIFETYKQEWTEKNIAWDYEIIEVDHFCFDLTQKLPSNYTVQIKCGVGLKTCIYADTVLPECKDNHAAFDYACLETWKKLLWTLGVIGVRNLYQETVKRNRAFPEVYNGVAYGQNPLTPNEVYDISTR